MTEQELIEAIEVINEIKSGYVTECGDCDDYCSDCDVKSICFDFSAIQALNIAIEALYYLRRIAGIGGDIK